MKIQNCVCWLPLQACMNQASKWGRGMNIKSTLGAGSVGQIFSSNFSEHKKSLSSFCLSVVFASSISIVTPAINAATLEFNEPDFLGVYGDAIPLDIVYSIDDGDQATTDWFREWTITLRDSTGFEYDFNSASSSIEDLKNYLWSSTVSFPQPGNYKIDLLLGTFHAVGNFDPNCSPQGGCWNHDFDDILQNDSVLAVMNVSLAPIPIPPAVWLFGSGLLGLIGFARSKAA